MANKNVTRENIHGGLSQSKSDEKWSDMLNFRCSTNRTFVVPRKFKLHEVATTFHTVVRGFSDKAYAFGNQLSVLFRGNDSTLPQKLWRACVVRDVATSDQTENLKLRGSYLGTLPMTIKVSVVAGRLVRDINWKAPILDDDGVEDIADPGEFALELTVNQREAQWTYKSYKSYKKGDRVYKTGTYTSLRGLYNDGNLGEYGNNVMATVPVIPQTFVLEANQDITDLNAGMSKIPWIEIAPYSLFKPYEVGDRYLDLANHTYYKCIQKHIGVNKDRFYHYRDGVVYNSYEPDSNWRRCWVADGKHIDLPVYQERTSYEIGQSVYVGSTKYTCKYTHERGADFASLTYPPNDTQHTIWDIVTSPAPIPAANVTVRILQGNDIHSEHTTNANGQIRAFVTPNDYNIQLIRDDLVYKQIVVTVGTALQATSTTLTKL